jgi:hypothetical protein
MAVKYVYSAAAGAANGSTWADAYTTLAAAFAGMAAGDTAYVADDHAETQASAMTLTSPGTAADPCRVLCARRSGGSVPPVSADLRTTGTITTTGANAITLEGFAYCYGLTFSCGTGASTASIVFGAGSAMGWTLEACKLILVNTSASSTIALGSTSAVNYGNKWLNTTVKFAATGQAIMLAGGVFEWKGTASAVDAAGSIPTTLVKGTSRTGSALIEGVDLSALGAGSTIFGAASSASQLVAKDCKLGSSVTPAATPTAPGSKASLIRCDSGDTNYTQSSYQYGGTQTVETTIVRTGGASDGTTSVAWKLVTTANPEWHAPFECLPIVIWNETTGSAVTVTVEGVWDAGAVPNDDEIWLEAEYLGTSGFPLGNFANDSKADILATAAAQTSSSETWTTTGLSTPVKFKLSKQITPAEKGPITVYVKAAKASSTFYVCPKVSVA